MNFITKRKSRKLFADRRGKAKQPKFKDKDLKHIAEFDIVLGIEHYNAGWNANYSSAYMKDDDDTSSISSCSTNATMDNIPGTGRTIDMCFYQPAGRAIERIALKIAIRLNICHPSPAQIIRVLRLSSWNRIWLKKVKKPGDVINAISAEKPTHARGILSLVQQSQ